MTDGAPELERCSCGTSRRPMLYRYGSRSLLQGYRCPRCRLSGGLMATAEGRAFAWNDAVRRARGGHEPIPIRPADWVDLTVMKIAESGLDWKVRHGDGEAVLISKSAAQLERGPVGAVLTLSIPVDYARREGLLS